MPQLGRPVSCGNPDNLAPSRFQGVLDQGWTCLASFDGASGEGGQGGEDGGVDLVGGLLGVDEAVVDGVGFGLGEVVGVAPAGGIPSDAARGGLLRG